MISDLKLLFLKFQDSRYLQRDLESSCTQNFRKAVIHCTAKCHGKFEVLAYFLPHFRPAIHCWKKTFASEVTAPHLLALPNASHEQTMNHAI
jgi:hypothetical protein